MWCDHALQLHPPLGLLRLVPPCLVFLTSHTPSAHVPREIILRIMFGVVIPQVLIPPEEGCRSWRQSCLQLRTMVAMGEVSKACTRERSSLPWSAPRRPIGKIYIPWLTVIVGHLGSRLWSELRRITIQRYSRSLKLAPFQSLSFAIEISPTPGWAGDPPASNSNRASSAPPRPTCLSAPSSPSR